MHQKDTVQVSLLDLMEDNRFREIRKIKKKEMPAQLQWFAGQDYLFEELLGLYPSEIEKFRHATQEAYAIFEKATDKIIKEKQLALLNIPSFFHNVIEKTWNDRHNHPFLYGRFDLNGGIKQHDIRVIEFNADTCSSVPETVLWQKLQLAELDNVKGQFNSLEVDIKATLEKLRSTISFDDACFMASSFGHPEDIMNCNVILDAASKAGFNVFYSNLEDVVFSDEGVFYEIGGEYQPVDVWFKIIPWDWMFNEEVELARKLSDLISKDLVRVLNPPFTTIWQNKLFLSYITEHFPNNYIAETYNNQSQLMEKDYVEKPIYGRMGENVRIPKKRIQSKGDYETQQKVYQRFYPLEKDSEGYFYQLGMFYTHQPSAINLRAEDNEIITNECEFMSHYIINFLN